MADTANWVEQFKVIGELYERRWDGEVNVRRLVKRRSDCHSRQEEQEEGFRG
jgi:hypothetical protein